MIYHDPRREVEKLRDHLASNERPVALLVGAGASCAVRDPKGEALIPAVAALGDVCAQAVAALGTKYSEIYKAVTDQIETTPGRATGVANIEEILSAVRLAISAMGAADTIAGGTKAQLAEIDIAVRTAIAGAALPEEARIPDELPQHALARWIAHADRRFPVEIFTTNYDTLLERALEDERVPVFDGFTGGRMPFFLSATPTGDDEPGFGWTRLWKIHGSVTWIWHEPAGQRPRIVRGPEHAGGELILPSFHKYDESRRQPYASMLDRLGRVLGGREDTLLVTIGFSFGDEHLNAVVFDALNARPRLSVFALQHSDPAPDHELVRRAERHSNLLVYGPGRAVVGSRVAEWQLQEPVDEKTAALLDIPFDSDAKPEKDDVADTGRFRLGDFRWFARFLDTLTRSDD
ncbi:MAG: SIR2 family protein [Solirubrobacteraceae bacterium]